MIHLPRTHPGPAGELENFLNFLSCPARLAGTVHESCLNTVIYSQTLGMQASHSLRSCSWIIRLTSRIHNIKHQLMGVSFPACICGEHRCLAQIWAPPPNVDAKLEQAERKPMFISFSLGKTQFISCHWGVPLLFSFKLFVAFGKCRCMIVIKSINILLLGCCYHGLYYNE